LEGDLRDADCVARAVRGIDIIFHEAAFVSVPQSMLEPLPCFEINQHGTELLLDAARKAKVSRVVLASSAAVYGDLDELPLEEMLIFSHFLPTRFPSVWMSCMLNFLRVPLVWM